MDILVARSTSRRCSISGHVRCGIVSPMVSMSLEILCFRSVMSHTFVRYIIFFTQPQRKKSKGVKSDERDSHGIGPSLPIHHFRKVS